MLRGNVHGGGLILKGKSEIKIKMFARNGALPKMGKGVTFMERGIFTFTRKTFGHDF